MKPAANGQSSKKRARLWRTQSACCLELAQKRCVAPTNLFKFCGDLRLRRSSACGRLGFADGIAFMFERNDSVKLRRVAAALAVLLSVAIATVWLAGPGSSRRDLQTWVQSAVGRLDQPSPRGFEDVVARVKPAVFGIRAKVPDDNASADDQGQGFLPR